MSEITVKFKDFKKNIHPVQVAPEASVADTKQQLCDALQNGTAVDQIKLIYSGKVLANPKTVASYGIKDQDQVIFMVSKKKQPSPAPAQDTAPTVTDPILAESASASASAPETASTAEAPAPVTAAPEAVSTSEVPAAVTADAPPAELVTRLMELGYSHAEAVMALQLANNDPNRACELLLMGLTEQNENDQDAHMDLGDDDHAEAAGEHGEGEGDDDDDDDLFAQAAAAAGGSAPAGSSAAGAGAGAAGNQQPRSISLTMEDLMQLRRIVNGDPESLQPFLENMISRYPQLEDQIQRSPEMFLAMLLEGLGGNIPGDLDDQMQMGGDGAVAAGSLAGEDEAGAAPPANTIQLTQEENDAINRLCELGNFERNLVIQIYFACDKNEEIAANMLFMEHSTD